MVTSSCSTNATFLSRLFFSKEDPDEYKSRIFHQSVMDILYQLSLSLYRFFFCDFVGPFFIYYHFTIFPLASARIFLSFLFFPSLPWSSIVYRVLPPPSSPSSPLSYHITPRFLFTSTVFVIILIVSPFFCFCFCTTFFLIYLVY